MRKWIWGGTALLVFSVAGVYLAASHAVSNPTSLLARCAHIGAVVGSRFVGGDSWTSSGSASVKVADMPCAVDRPEADVAPAEVLEPIVVAEAVEAEVPQAFELPVGEGAEVSEPSFSPEVADGLPEFMPYVEEAVDHSGLPCSANAVDQDWLLNWFISNSCCGEEEQECDSGCWLQAWLQQIVNAFRGMAAVTEVSPEVNIEALPEGEEPAEPQQPIALPGVEGVTDRCQEDPHHYHHYPSCPYTGRCPLPYPRPRAVVPSMEPPRSPYTPPERTEPTERPMRQPKNPDTAVDTLECRPYDGPEDYGYDQPF